jgi:simple sugar transport system ATP-binding protein
MLGAGRASPAATGAAGSPPDSEGELEDEDVLSAATGPHRIAPAGAGRAPGRVGTPEPPAVIRARGVSLADERGVVRVRDATLEIRGGEIVGVAGVEGSGHRELLRALAVRARPIAGTIDAPAAVGFVPEDRHRDALVLEFPLHENVALRGAGRRRGLVPWTALRQATAALLARYDVRAPSADVPAAALSGGNQQKLVLGRELAAEHESPPAALVVENPTRGLDVRAAADVHRRLRAAREAGTAVVLYSSDLDEVVALSDRVLVVYAGVLREVPADRDAVGRAMLGVV